MHGEAEELPIVGVIGAGSFGTAVSNLLAHNARVLLYSRHPEVVARINQTHRHFDMDLSPRIRATGNLQEVPETCTLLFPIVPSANFREMMRDLSPFLRPYHLVIHGTKGLDIRRKEYDTEDSPITRDQVCTMSEIIRQESVVVRIGCLSGPNLAREIMAGQPTATVIASSFDEVIEKGKKVLSSRFFQVLHTYELIGAELAGALKNVVAVGSGILGGLGMGKNIQGILITQGLMEMIRFGNVMGATPQAFLGTAGIGDLIATATSTQSRNYTFGLRLGRGETVDAINASLTEVAEGVRTILIAKQLADHYKLDVPITQTLYRVIYEGADIFEAIESLIRFPGEADVDFI
ncbi:MAG: NAD(P)-dependent glycerol-3-phosphate dehydrogenase [Saprospirales bacterium]|nr:NAD(P)-dependent glycerol-3-phosphate dehydrogenase [Saprospirales bacterium]MBK8490510.1 NAD(P)-dependent glycerol-3-phosphate dehydrogenase [Saprospirales bacterium]